MNLLSKKLEIKNRNFNTEPSLQLTIGLGVVGGFENRLPGTKAQLKN